MPNFKTLTGLALVLALATAGCGGTDENKGGEVKDRPHVSDTPMEPSTVKHAPLSRLEERLDAAVAAPDFDLIQMDVNELEAGADAIQADRPATLSDEDQLRYEGLVAELKQKAGDLRKAAEAGNKHGVQRAFTQTTRACVSCHDSFGPKRSAGPGAP